MQEEHLKTESGPSAGGLGRERIAGLVLVVFGAAALWAGSDLPFTTSDGIGSGLLPRTLSIVIIVLGILQLIVSWKYPGEPTGRWAIREMVPVIIGVILFAVTVRGHHIGPVNIPPLGLAVASPLAIIASGLAARDARIVELLIFAVLLTAFCIGLFRFALGLSIPVAPWLIGY